MVNKIRKYIVVRNNVNGCIKVITNDEYKASPASLFEPIFDADYEDEANILLERITRNGIENYLK